MMENYFYSIEDDLLEFYDGFEYPESIDSPDSTGSDLENQHFDHPHQGLKSPLKKVLQRKAANMRERRRMKSINEAFENLRSHIPMTVNADRRLSKVDTLRLAIQYISYLSETVSSCSDYTCDSQFVRGKSQEKIILRCNYADPSDEESQHIPLIGHSLSWSDDKTPQKTADNKFIAKLWFPEHPTEDDIINLSNLSSDFSSCS